MVRVTIRNDQNVQALLGEIFFLRVGGEVRALNFQPAKPPIILSERPIDFNSRPTILQDHIPYTMEGTTCTAAASITSPWLVGTNEFGINIWHQPGKKPSDYLHIPWESPWATERFKHLHVYIKATKRETRPLRPEELILAQRVSRIRRIAFEGKSGLSLPEPDDWKPHIKMVREMMNGGAVPLMDASNIYDIHESPDGTMVYVSLCQKGTVPYSQIWAIDL